MKISPRSEKLKDDTAKDHFIATMSIGYRRCVPASKNSENKSRSNLSSSPLRRPQKLGYTPLFKELGKP